MIRTYLSGIINDYKTQGEWKINLTLTTNFISSKDSDETQIMHSRNDNLEIMMGSQTCEIVEELFESLLQRYQEGLESMKESKFIFDSVNSLYYKLHKISLNRSGSYIDSPEWLKNKKVTTNPKNNDKECFQYALKVALHYQSIKKDPQRISEN